MDESTKTDRATRYVATVSVPGYLPVDDDPPVFTTAADAWAWLANQRRHDEDSATEIDEPGPDVLPYSVTVAELDSMARVTGADALGTVYGATPGYDGRHDLDLAYSVSETDETDESDEDN
jgi:hypothetical protein